MDNKERNRIYNERNVLVSILSKCFSSHLCKHKGDYEKGWFIVCIHLPTGQVSWHIPKEELKFFRHLKWKENDWDGHDTEEKYERLIKLKITAKTGSKGCGKGLEYPEVNCGEEFGGKILYCEECLKITVLTGSEE